MADLVVVVPTRGRPEAARALVQHFKNTCTADTHLVFAVDGDDPARDEYADATFATPANINTQSSGTMVTALNKAATEIICHSAPFAVGFMGDDHMPRTVGWDTAYLDALHEMGTGIVYGNDEFQKDRLPTQCAMTADIVRALGYMAPPSLVHLWVDNTWMAWGNGLGRLRYLPDVVIEHRHPLAGKAAWDDGYARVNSAATAGHDHAAFTDYCRTQLDEDLGKLRKLLAATT